MRRLSLFLIFFSFLTKSYSESGNERHFNFGAGWAHLGFRDEGISQLYYKGGHGIISAGYQNITDILMNVTEVKFIAGNTYPETYPDLVKSQISSMRAAINYSHLRYIGNFLNQNSKLFLGGSMVTQMAEYKHDQFTNSSVNYFFLSSFNINSSLSYSLIKNKSSCLLLFQMDLPVISFLVRPSYAYIMPEGFLIHSEGTVKRLIKSIEASSLNKFFGLNTNISIEYKLKKNNSLRFGYRWEYFGHKNSNQFKSATHGITLQTMINL